LISRASSAFRALAVFPAATCLSIESKATSDSADFTSVSPRLSAFMSFSDARRSSILDSQDLDPREDRRVLLGEAVGEIELERREAAVALDVREVRLPWNLPLLDLPVAHRESEPGLEGNGRTGGRPVRPERRRAGASRRPIGERGRTTGVEVEARRKPSASISRTKVSRRTV
jgi:hypothetical protein